MDERERSHSHAHPSTTYDALSEDLWLSVLRYVDWQDLKSASQTCRYLFAVAQRDVLWHNQWTVEYGTARSSRMASNAMGACAVHHSYQPQREAARAVQLLSHRPNSAGISVPAAPQRQSSGPLPGSPPSSVPSPPDTGWKEIFRRSQGVDRAWAQGRSSASESLEGHQDFIRCMQLSGDTLVSCSGSISHVDCSIRVWDLSRNTCTKVLRGHMGPIWCMMYDPTVNRIASGSDDYTVRYWDATSGNCLVMQDPDSAVRCVHMDGAGRQLVAGTEFGRLLLWDMDGLEELLSAGVENVVQEFERLDQANGGPVQRALQAGTAALGPGGAAARRTVALLDGRQVVVDGSNHVRVLDTPDEGKAISSIQVQGGLCASTSNEAPSPIQLWDVSQNSWRLAMTVFEPAMHLANCMSFEKPLNRLVAGCGDRNVRVWDLTTGARVLLLEGHTDEIHAHQFDEKRVAAAALSGHVRLWDARTGVCTHTLAHGAPLHAFQYDGHRLVSGTWDGRVCLWDLRGGQGQGALVKEWFSHNERVWAVAMDRYRITSAGLDRLISVRTFIPTDTDTRQGGPVHEQHTQAGAAAAAAAGDTAAAAAARVLGSGGGSGEAGPSGAGPSGMRSGAGSPSTHTARASMGPSRIPNSIVRGGVVYPLTRQSSSSVSSGSSESSGSAGSGSRLLLPPPSSTHTYPHTTLTGTVTGSDDPMSGTEGPESGSLFAAPQSHTHTQYVSTLQSPTHQSILPPTQHNHWTTHTAQQGSGDGQQGAGTSRQQGQGDTHASEQRQQGVRSRPLRPGSVSATESVGELRRLLTGTNSSTSSGSDSGSPNGETSGALLDTAGGSASGPGGTSAGMRGDGDHVSCEGEGGGYMGTGDRQHSGLRRCRTAPAQCDVMDGGDGVMQQYSSGASPATRAMETQLFFGTDDDMAQT